MVMEKKHTHIFDRGKTYQQRLPVKKCVSGLGVEGGDGMSLMLNGLIPGQYQCNVRVFSLAGLGPDSHTNVTFVIQVSNSIVYPYYDYRAALTITTITPTVNTTNNDNYYYLR